MSGGFNYIVTQTISLVPSSPSATSRNRYFNPVISTRLLMESIFSIDYSSKDHFPLVTNNENGSSQWKREAIVKRCTRSFLLITCESHVPDYLKHSSPQRVAGQRVPTLISARGSSDKTTPQTNSRKGFPYLETQKIDC